MLQRLHFVAHRSAGSPSALGVAFVGLVALAVAMGIGRFAFTPILPMMQEDVGMSVPEGGWLASANFLGYLVGALSAIGMTIKPTAVIRVGLIVIGLSTLAMGFTHEFFLWVALRVIAGIASAWVLVFVSTWSLGWLNSFDRSDLAGAIYAGVGMGIIVAGGTCLALMGIHAASSDAWRILGLISLAAAAAIWSRLHADPIADRQDSSRTTKNSWGPQSLVLVFCYGAFGFGYIIPATFLPVMAKAEIIDTRLFGLAWPIFGAAAATSTLLVAHLSRVLTHRRIWIAAALVMALGALVPILAPGLSGIVTAALFVGGTFMVITMAGMQESKKIAGQDAHTLMAAITSAFAVGQIAGPISVSYLAGSNGGFSEALLIAGALLCMSAAVLSLSANSGADNANQQTSAR